jgi:uncharacterized phage-associated protein
VLFRDTLAYAGRKRNLMKTTKIQYKAKTDKIIETILYLAWKNIELSRYKIVKLIYLAECEHLNRYGRPITYDRIVAMKNGPVPSTLYSILKKDQRYKIDYDELPFDFVSRGDYDYIENPKRAINQKLFSKSDLKVLDEVAEQYGDNTFKQLYDLTHAHKGYQAAWGKRQDKESVPIDFEDMIKEDHPSKDELIEHLQLTCKHVL